MSIDYLKEMLRRHEGVRLTPYFCPAGKKTIGIGWNMDAHKLPDDIASCLRVTGSITEEMADRLLNISITDATDNCRGIYKGFDDFSEARRFALIDFVFNVGIGTAIKFKKMRAAILAGNWDRAADEMLDSDWFKQVGSRGPEIVGMVRIG
jgi:lysozyme